MSVDLSGRMVLALNYAPWANVEAVVVRFVDDVWACVFRSDDPDDAELSYSVEPFDIHSIIW